MLNSGPMSSPGGKSPSPPGAWLIFFVWLFVEILAPSSKIIKSVVGMFSDFGIQDDFEMGTQNYPKVIYVYIVFTKLWFLGIAKYQNCYVYMGFGWFLRMTGDQHSIGFIYFSVSDHCIYHREPATRPRGSSWNPDDFENPEDFRNPQDFRNPRG